MKNGHRLSQFLKFLKLALQNSLNFEKQDVIWVGNLTGNVSRHVKEDSYTVTLGLTRYIPIILSAQIKSTKNIKIHEKNEFQTKSKPFWRQISDGWVEHLSNTLYMWWVLILYKKYNTRWNSWLRHLFQLVLYFLYKIRTHHI